MKNKIGLLVFSMLLLVISACSNVESIPFPTQEIHADWAVHSFKELVAKKSQLIAIAAVKSVSTKEEKDIGLTVQESSPRGD